MKHENYEKQKLKVQSDKPLVLRLSWQASTIAIFNELKSMRTSLIPKREMDINNLRKINYTLHALDHAYMTRIRLIQCMEFFVLNLDANL